MYTFGEVEGKGTENDQESCGILNYIHFTHIKALRPTLAETVPRRKLEPSRFLMILVASGVHALP